MTRTRNQITQESLKQVVSNVANLYAEASAIELTFKREKNPGKERTRSFLRNFHSHIQGLETQVWELTDGIYEEGIHNE